MATGTKNFDRAIRINIGIEKLLCSELKAIRHRRQRVLCQLKRSQMQLRNEISKSRDDSFQMKTEERLFHQDVDAVVKLFTKNVFKKNKNASAQIPTQTKNRHHRDDASNSSVFSEDLDSFSSASSDDETVDDNPDQPQWLNENRCHSASAPIKPKTSSGIDSRGKQTDPRANKEVSINMAWNTMISQVTLERENPTFRVESEGLGLQRSDLSQQDKYNPAFVLHVDAQRKKTADLQFTQQNHLTMYGPHALVICHKRGLHEYKGSENSGSQYKQPRSVEIPRTSSTQCMKDQEFFRKEISQRLEPGSTDVGFNFRPITTASPSRHLSRHEINRKHRPTTAFGFVRNPAHDRYQQSALNAPTALGQQTTGSNQPKADINPNRALSSYGRRKLNTKKVVSRTIVNHTDQPQESQYRMQLKLRRQQTENDAIARRVWQFIGKRPLGVSVNMNAHFAHGLSKSPIKRFK